MVRAPSQRKKIAPLTEVDRLKKRNRLLSQKLSESIPKEEVENKLKEFGLWKSRSRTLNKSKMDKLQVRFDESESRNKGLVSQANELQIRINENLYESNKKILGLESKLGESKESTEAEKETIRVLEGARGESERKLHVLESRVLELEGILGGMIPREELEKSEGRSADLEKELAQARTELYSSRSGMSELEANNSQLELRLEGSIPKEDYDDRINELNTKLAELQIRVAEGAVSQDEMDQCRKRVTSLENDLASAREELARSTIG